MVCGFAKLGGVMRKAGLHRYQVYTCIIGKSAFLRYNRYILMYREAVQFCPHYTVVVLLYHGIIDVVTACLAQQAEYALSKPYKYKLQTNTCSYIHSDHRIGCPGLLLSKRNC
jgi:hypothetical protein